jgi:Excalibur calcium-binding domain
MSSAQQAGQNQYFGRIAAAAMGLTLGFGGTTLLFPAADKPEQGVNRLVSATPAMSPGARAAANDVDYASCSAVRVAGAAPIRRGQPGYARHLDADGDGVGCE